MCSRTLFRLRLLPSVVSWTSMSIKRSADSARKADTIRKKVLIEAAPAFIFRALTEAKEITQWFCDRVTSDPRVGGELKAFWRMGNGGQALRGRAIFTTLVPDSQVELQWIDEGDGQCPEGEHHTTSLLDPTQERNQRSHRVRRGSAAGGRGDAHAARRGLDRYSA